MIVAGSTVVTPRFGKGTVVSVSGGMALVNLVIGVRVNQPLSDLRLVDTVPTPPAPPPAVEKPKQRRLLDPARQSIEALRYGLVPHAHLDDLTINLPALESWIESRLPLAHNGAPQVSEVSGAFGSGKSHMMALVRHVARKQNYLAARVEVDGQNVTLAEPEKLLYTLWATLHGRDLESDMPLLDLYRMAHNRSRVPPLVAVDGIDRVRENFGALRQIIDQQKLDDVAHLFDAVVSSSDEYGASDAMNEVRRLDVRFDPSMGQLRKMIGHKVEDRPYDFVESLAGHALLARQAGYSGLVVTIDEFEVETSSLTPVQRDRLEKLVWVLDEYLHGRTRQRPAPLAMFFASVGDADHEGDMIISQLVSHTTNANHHLAQLNPEDHVILAARIAAHYAQAYNVRLPAESSLAEDVIRRVNSSHGNESGLTRAFIKAFVAELDSQYGPQRALQHVA